MPTISHRASRLLPLACLLLAAAGPHEHPAPVPAVAPAPPPLSAPEPVSGSPAVPAAPEPLEAALPTSPHPAAPVRTDRLRLTGLMDREVIGADKLDIGHVIDVLVDTDGEPRAVLVETGGFLGIGNRQIAVDWTGLSFPETKPGGPIRTGMTIDQIRSAPAYKNEGPVTVAVGTALPTPPGPTEPPPPPTPLAALAIAGAREPAPLIATPPPPLPSPPPSTRATAPRTR